MILWIWECTHQHFCVVSLKTKQKQKNTEKCAERETSLYSNFAVLLFRTPFSNFKFSLNFTRISWIFPPLENKQKKGLVRQLILAAFTPIRYKVTDFRWLTERENSNICSSVLSLPTSCIIRSSFGILLVGIVSRKFRTGRSFV